MTVIETIDIDIRNCKPGPFREETQLSISVIFLNTVHVQRLVGFWSSLLILVFYSKSGVNYEIQCLIYPLHILRRYALFQWKSEVFFESQSQIVPWSRNIACRLTDRMKSDIKSPIVPPSIVWRINALLLPLSNLTHIHNQYIVNKTIS